MTIQTKNFYAYGLPTGIVANKGIVYTNVQDGKQYVQLTVPYGSNWVANGLTNFFYYPTSGAVGSVTGTAPIQSSGGTNPNISIPKADATTDGYLSSADWNTFNSGSSVTPSALTRTNDTNVTLALTGSPTSALLQAVNIAVGWSGTLADSRISSASVWNAKQNALAGSGLVKSTGGTISYVSGTSSQFVKGDGSLDSNSYLTSAVTSVGATSPITSSGGATPTISTSMNTNKLIGRSTAGTGVMEEISVGSGLTLSGGSLSASINNSITHADALGTDTYTTTITGVTSYADGDCYLIRFINGNTTGATINVNGLGAVTLYRNNDGALVGGDIVNGAEMLLVYNSTLGGFQCIGTAPNTLLAYVTNAESITINKGQPVYVFGGQGDRITVKLAYNTTDMTSAQTIGLVQSTSIGANQKGLIIVQGQLDNLNLFPTSTWADGDYVYLGATPGTITNVKPFAPNHLVYLGYVTTASNGNAGRMYVKVQNGYELKELHDVQATSPTNKDTLYYDSSVSQWKTSQIGTIVGNASAVNTGVLSSTDWSTFNGKATSPWAFRLSGRWYTPSTNALAIGSSLNVANSIRYSPFIVERDITITQLGISVVTVAGTGNTARVGIYTNNASTNQPLTRLVDSGTIALDGSTGQRIVTGLSVTLTKGLYWFAYFSNANSAGTIASIANLNLPDVIGTTSTLNNGLITGYSQSLTYTSLPATASGFSNILSGASSYCIFYYY
jgi:hypothetical protein